MFTKLIIKSILIKESSDTEEVFLGRYLKRSAKAIRWGSPCVFVVSTKMRKKEAKYFATFLVFLLTLGEIHASNGYIKYHNLLSEPKRRSIKNNNAVLRTKRDVSEIKEEVAEGTAVSESRKKRKYSISIICYNN